jgi:hypothetical protein
MKLHITTHLAAPVIGLTAVAALLTGTSSQAMAATGATCTPSQPTIDYKPAVTKATAALTKALNNLQNHQYVKAANHLSIVGHQTRIANTAATALIGRPPTDPESDELPGVAAVQRVTGLDHKVASQLLPTLHGLDPADTVRQVGSRLDTAVACRHAMLEKVIALKAGAREDYADGLADTLPSYDQELTAMATTLGGTGLTDAARTYVQNAQQVVTTTRTDMQRVFGGGERSPGLPR